MFNRQLQTVAKNFEEIPHELFLLFISEVKISPLEKGNTVTIAAHVEIVRKHCNLDVLVDEGQLSGKPNHLLVFVKLGQDSEFIVIPIEHSTEGLQFTVFLVDLLLELNRDVIRILEEFSHAVKHRISLFPFVEVVVYGLFCLLLVLILG